MTQSNQKQLIPRALSYFKSSPELNSHQSLWKALVHAIVRPPRSSYSDESLGNSPFLMNDKIYYREDHYIPHANNKQIYLNIFRNAIKQKYVILYLHGNTSNRLESIHILNCAPDQYAVASFDFFGCGNSTDEETISLGYREAEQARTAIRYLKQLDYEVIVWGKSMGAVTALLAGESEFIVSDSAFTSFRSLCKSVAKQNSPSMIPNFCISCIFPCVFLKLKKDVSKKAAYDVDKLDVLNSMRKIDHRTVIIFMSGNQDELIHHKNSEKLYRAFKGPSKYLQIFEGTHNSRRSPQVLDRIFMLLQSHILRREEQQNGSQIQKKQSPSSRPLKPLNISGKKLIQQKE